MSLPNISRMNAEETGVVRIVLQAADGTETAIDITEDLHYLFAYAKTSDWKPGVGYPLEMYLKGTTAVIGELFYRIGDLHPELVAFCRRRAMENVDAMLKDAPTTGGTH